MVESSKNFRIYKKIWLIIIMALTFGIIAIGAYTRLTGSGLSMVNWQLLLGVFPPMSDEAWLKSFQQYQQYPEFNLLRPNTTLAEYKGIFMVEYLHRMLGRIIGLMVFIPLVVFALLKALSKKETLHFSLLFVLVLVQGLVGWYMVKSGLVDIPRVSHFRLTLHLVLAIGFLCYAFVLYKSLPENEASTTKDTSRGKIYYLFPLSFSFLSVQIIFGALVAGLKAGYITQEYPKMFGEWIPLKAINEMNTSMFSNPVLLNFIHRHLGVMVAALIACTAIGAMSNKKMSSNTKKSSFFLLILTALQPLLGIMVVASSVHLHSAIMHQVVAIAMLLLLLNIWISESKQKWILF